MTPQTVRRKIYPVFVGLFLYGLLFVTHIQTSVHAAKTDYISQKDGFVARTSIRAGEIWKGTETRLQGRSIGSVALTITAILPGQSDPIRGYWGDDRTLLFFGHEETYAQAPLGSLAYVIKTWGRSPVDRYITFTYTDHWFGIMIEGRSERLMGIEAELGGDEYYKFVLNKVSLAHIKRWVR
jgi:hypothetical protein